MSHRVAEKILCYHCGDTCENPVAGPEGKQFCCDGCKLVYEILAENNLSSYYVFNSSPGRSQRKNRHDEQFAYLDSPAVRQKLIQFTDGNSTRITFSLPQIHCSSCVWLLEHLDRINDGVIRSLVNFNRREASILFDENKISLRRLVEMLSTIGYEPALGLDSLSGKKSPKKNYTAYYKIGIAGFCFGNIMLFSFPDYFSADVYSETGFHGIFSYLNFALSLPVFFYCSSQFFRSAWQSLKQKFLNIDVPIALGILVMFIRSSYEIGTGTGAGFMDTMSGLVFFMLVGREFQNKTYAAISFDREYESFFPASVLVKKEGKETTIPVSDIREGDHLVIRNEELIPADSALTKGEAIIDYSFVTGESAPVRVQTGELIYAGGRQTGPAIDVRVTKTVSQSYLTQLWNADSYLSKNESSPFQQLVNRISHYFTIVLLAFALAALGYWTVNGNPGLGWNAFTAVLIIACPCALAISSPFTLGNLLRIFGRKGFYLKNFLVIEKLARVDSVVFDKTGTLTDSSSSLLSFEGTLTEDQTVMIKSVASHSSHALSKLLCQRLENTRTVDVDGFSETAGQGIRGVVFGVDVKIGLPAYLGLGPSPQEAATRIYVSGDGIVWGSFLMNNRYREGVSELAHKLSGSGYQLSVLSGDHDGERSNLQALFPEKTKLFFRQAPADKLRFVQKLQRSGKKVLMMGDGLNDAGALKQSDVGISLSDNLDSFSPACDGILDARRLSTLPGLLRAARASRWIILGSFAIALLYNIIGLSYAVSGTLSPVVAAILMPLSTVTIISFTTGVSNLAASILK